MPSIHFDQHSFFVPYQSASFSQKFLRRIYEANQLDEPLAKSYQNGYTFTYYLIHGQRFFDQALLAPYEIKPLLLFYGTVQFCKACLLTIDQDYPTNSTVLAHGVSTRKIKKQNFEFLNDSVLIQKRGLFSHMATTLFGHAPLEGRKFQMAELFHFIPDLREINFKIKEKPLCRRVHKKADQTYQTSGHLLQDLGMTKDRFFQHFSHFLQEEGGLDTELTFSLKNNQQPSFIFLKDKSEDYFFSSFRLDYPLLPELLAHYLILYNLSMITRYETEWWNDLFLQRSSHDISFIQAIIDIAQEKIPSLINEFLTDKDPVKQDPSI